MIQVNDLTDETIQRHIIQFEQDEIVFVLKYIPFAEIWIFDLTFKGRSVNGIKLTVGTLHIRSENFPFDFAVTDNSGDGLDPFRTDDWSNERTSLFMLEADDMESIRGVSVQI